MTRFNSTLYSALLPTLKYLREHPDQFDMGTWFSTEEDGQSACGTVMCLAGAHVHVNRPYQSSQMPPQSEISAIARTMLGLSRDDADRLFHTSNWPSEFKTRHNDLGFCLSRLRWAMQYKSFAQWPPSLQDVYKEISARQVNNLSNYIAHVCDTWDDS